MTESNFFDLYFNHFYSDGKLEEFDPENIVPF